jgi:hypothetical protein
MYLALGLVFRDRRGSGVSLLVASGLLALGSTVAFVNGYRVI